MANRRTKTSPPPSQPSGGRYRRTGWAFVVLALAVVIGLREWFGISGAAGSVLHHIAAGPLGVLGITVPLLLVGLGIAMLRARRLGSGGVRIGVGCLGVLTGVTGIIQVCSGNPSLDYGIAPLEEAGGLLGWVVGYPLATLFSAVGAVILFVLLIIFSALVISGKTVADIRERLAERRRDAGDDGPAPTLATRTLSRVRRVVSGDEAEDPRDANPTTRLEAYDGDEPFRTALE
ncbi:DNA translocase FtsK 4TM domain-containing protein, partial [Actinomyces sp. MRS3W]